MPLRRQDGDHYQQVLARYHSISDQQRLASARRLRTYRNRQQARMEPQSPYDRSFRTPPAATPPAANRDILTQARFSGGLLRRQSLVHSYTPEDNEYGSELEEDE